MKKFLVICSLFWWLVCYGKGNVLKADRLNIHRIDGRIWYVETWNNKLEKHLIIPWTEIRYLEERPDDN